MRAKLARFIAILSLLIPVYFAVAALGARFGLFTWQFSLGTLIIEWGPRLIIATLVLAGVILVATLVKAPRKGWRWALVALVLPALALSYLGWVRSQSQGIPPIHDISTRASDPPVFSPALMAARATTPGSNPVGSLTVPISTFEKYQGPRFSAIADRSLGEVAAEAYPEVRPLVSTQGVEATFTAAVAEARAQGWTIVSEDAASGLVEATATTFWFGFKDDVAIRVRSEGQGSVVDVRSTSRVGLSDMGANAARIEAYLSGLAARL